MKSAMIAVVCTAAIASIAWLAPLSDDKSKEKSDSLRTDRKVVESLIAQLKSPNKDPNPKNEPLADYPKDYDSEAQEKVEKAREKLIALGKDAFPILIDHLNDEPYSRSISTAIWRSLTMGNVCFGIIEEQVDLIGMTYKARTGSDGKEYTYRGYFSSYCEDHWYSQAGVQKWWKENKHQSIREMQIAALRWRIAKESKIGFPDKESEHHYLRPVLNKLELLEKAKSP
jgi:hypothetical protein